MKVSALLLLAILLGGLHGIQASPVTNPITHSVIVSTVNELTTALDAAKPGDTIYLRGGTYKCTSKITISRSGSLAQNIHLYAYPGDMTRPRLDFSSMGEKSSNQGVVLQASYWHVKGIDISKAGDNGLLITEGHHNVIEE